MKQLLINIQPTLFNYSGYLLEDNIVKELTSIPLNITDIATFAINRNIEGILLKGPEAYVKGIQDQLQEKITIPIEIYTEGEH